MADLALRRTGLAMAARTTLSQGSKTIALTSAAHQRKPARKLPRIGLSSARQSKTLAEPTKITARSAMETRGVLSSRSTVVLCTTEPKTPETRIATPMVKSEAMPSMLEIPVAFASASSELGTGCFGIRETTTAEPAGVTPIVRAEPRTPAWRVARSTDDGLSRKAGQVPCR